MDGISLKQAFETTSNDSSVLISVFSAVESDRRKFDRVLAGPRVRSRRTRPPPTVPITGYRDLFGNWRSRYAAA